LADYPCDWHHERYTGDSNRVFLNLYRGDEKAAFRASVCGQCLADIVNDWLSCALVKDPRGFWRIPDKDLVLEDAWGARRSDENGLAGRSMA
jgi:hypothetical protein